MEEATTRKERRNRRRAEKKMEDNMEEKIQKTIENVELAAKPRKTQSSGKLFRRDTYTLSKSRSDLDLPSNDVGEQLKISSTEASRNDSIESTNVTYSINKEWDESGNDTYKIEKSEGPVGSRPVPAPRRSKSTLGESEKVSSDTDRDVTEIDLDEMREPEKRKDSPDSAKDSASRIGVTSSSDQDDLVVVPIPKPRKLVIVPQTSPQKPENSSVQEVNAKNSNFQDKSDKSVAEVEFKDGGERLSTKSNELPLISNLRNENASKLDVDVKSNSKRAKRLTLNDLLDLKRKKKKSRNTFSSLTKPEKGTKMPKISSILKNSEEKESKENKMEEEKEEEEGDKSEFQTDLPYPESVQNGHIYVQNKNGFYVVGRDKVLRRGNPDMEGGGNGGEMEDSTVKTAILFQKYWSRSMMYFHGVLAGFAFSHAATVTAIILHYNYEPKAFINIYSCLSLKIHFVFYSLTALCIVSCFDRIDIGHMNSKHWEMAWKVPSMWIVLCLYLISFGLTFSNQKTEARFDAYLYDNATEDKIWDTKVQSDVQVGLITWYHTIWARDLLVLFAWLLVALTKFSDFLLGHLRNMTKYEEVKKEVDGLHRVTSQATDYL